jgi:hypothetical protein
MGAPDVLARLSALGVRLSREGDSLLARPQSALTDEARAMIRANKAALLEALAKPKAVRLKAGTGDASPGLEARRAAVLTMLADRQAVRYAVLADTETEAEAVLLAFAIRGAMADGGTVTCELRIPRDKYDPWLLLDLIERHGGIVH